MRHAGVGFPNGPVSNAAVFALPSPDLLMLATEGRWHHDAAAAAGKRVLWRAIPRIGKRPAELGWSPARFVAETINLTDAPAQPIRDFIPWNELDLRDERGDHEDDWSGLENRYRLIGGWAYSVVQMLKQWSPQTRIHWPAFTPDHEATEHTGFWEEAALLCDVLDFHAYDSLANIQREYGRLKANFPRKPLTLTEWHCKGDIEEERRVLQWLAETMRDDPLFEAAYFFIWRWFDHPGWWSDAWDIEHSADRLALFADAPTATPIPIPEPEPEPEPVPETPMTRDEIIALIVQKAQEHGEDPVEILGGAIAESGLDPNAARYGAWPDISFGLLQQTVAYADEGDQSNTPENIDLIRRLYSDPVHALDVGITKFSYWRHNPDVPELTAWVAYNSPGFYHTPEQSPNVENYRRSLAEARRILGGSEPTNDRLYVPDVPDAVILQRNAWSCAVRSTYAALWAMAQQGHGEPVTYGDVGPRDVYEWMVPKYDDPSVGLHAADGSGLVEMLRAHGYGADRLYPCLLSDVQARAGRQPVLLGGRAWNHWVYVNGVEPDGTLILENPSPGFGGISNELRDSFTRLGPMAMVWIDVPAAPEPTPAPDPDIDRLRTLVGVAYHESGTVVPALAAALANPDDANLRTQTDAVLRFLRANNPDAA